MRLQTVASPTSLLEIEKIARSQPFLWMLFALQVANTSPPN
jgi:hypothetical protein